MPLKNINQMGGKVMKRRCTLRDRERENKRRI
jgi:hypothetical protein